MPCHTLSARKSPALATLIILLGLAWTQRALAQETPLMQLFIGEWEGQGKLFGTDATFRMNWEWVLNKQFAHLTFQNSMQGTDGVDRVLEAEAFYKPLPDGRFDGTWFDSRGVVLPLQGSTAETALTTLWGTPETEQGKTVYRLLDADRMEVTDFVLQGEKWNQFGHALYTRVPRSP